MGRLNAMQLQNLAALAAAASAAQNTPSGTNALTTSSSPLSVLTSSGKRVIRASVSCVPWAESQEKGVCHFGEELTLICKGVGL